MSKEELRVKGLFAPLGPYILKDEVRMGVACVTLRLSLIKGGYVGHLQWEKMRKPPTTWANIYVYGVLGMGDNIFARDG